MQVSPPGDQISRLLHVVMIEICQRIVSFTSELVVNGMVCVTADGTEVCRIQFDDVIKGEDQGRFSVVAEHEKEETVLAKSSAHLNQQITPSDGQKDLFSDYTFGFESGAKSGIDNFGDVVIEEHAKNFENCRHCGNARDILASGCRRKGKVREKRRDLKADGDCMCYDSDYSISNLGKMILEILQQVAPEVMKASAILCRLGKLQQMIHDDNDDGISPDFNSHNLKNQKQGSDLETRHPSSISDLSAGFLPTFQPFVPDFYTKNQCRVCHKVFTFTTNLIRHQRNFHGRPFSRALRAVKGAYGSKTSYRRRLIPEVFKFGRPSDIVEEKIENNAIRNVDGFLLEDSVFGEEVLDCEVKTKCNAVGVNDTVGMNDTVGINDTVGDSVLSQFKTVLEFSEGSESQEQYPDEVLEVCDNTGNDKFLKQRIVSVKDDLSEKDKARTPKETLRVCDIDHVKSDQPSECYPFDDCPCWNRAEDSAMPNISVDVCDDNSSTYLEECASFDDASDGVPGEVLPATAERNALSKANKISSRVITVGSPESVKSLDPHELRIKKFDCSLCDAGFSMSNNLQRHMKKVHGVPRNNHPHVSPTFEPALDVLNCSSGANLRTSRSSRYRHICVLCDAAFTFRTNLTRHVKKIHGKIPIDTADTLPHL